MFYVDRRQETSLMDLITGDPDHRYEAIQHERDRQDLKWGYPQLNTFCEWASILGEEYGELAKELNELNFGRGDMHRMIEEACTSAVAVSIIEHAEVAARVTDLINISREGINHDTGEV